MPREPKLGQHPRRPSLDIEPPVVQVKDGEDGIEVQNEYRPGTLVRHPEWGLGVVQKQEGRGENLKLTIIFRDKGRKIVAAKYAKLERVSS